MLGMPENLRLAVELGPQEQVLGFWPASESDREEPPAAGSRTDTSIDPADGYLVLTNYRLRFLPYDPRYVGPTKRVLPDALWWIPLGMVTQVGLVEQGAFAGEPFVIRVSTEEPHEGRMGGVENEAGGRDYDIEIQNHQDPNGLTDQIIEAAQGARQALVDEEVEARPPPTSGRGGGTGSDSVIRYHAEEEEEE